MNQSKAPRILDATTGGKHIWHDEWKDSENVLFADRRQLEGLDHQEGWSCNPDVLLDARALPFKTETFDHIVFDPPHRVTDGGMQALSGVIEKKYGALRAETWQADLRAIFDELWRVLARAGTLTFKWADVHKSHSDVMNVLNRDPMYGVTTEKKRAVTKWWVFHKTDREINS